MASIAALNRGDQVLSKLFGGPIMTVLAVEGLKVRCTDERNQQYWFDMIVLERYLFFCGWCRAKARPASHSHGVARRRSPGGCVADCRCPLL